MIPHTISGFLAQAFASAIICGVLALIFDSIYFAIFIWIVIISVTLINWFTIWASIVIFGFSFVLGMLFSHEKDYTTEEIASGENKILVRVGGALLAAVVTTCLAVGIAQALPQLFNSHGGPAQDCSRNGCYDAD